MIGPLVICWFVTSLVAFMLWVLWDEEKNKFKIDKPLHKIELKDWHKYLRKCQSCDKDHLENKIVWFNGDYSTIIISLYHKVDSIIIVSGYPIKKTPGEKFLEECAKQAPGVSVEKAVWSPFSNSELLSKMVDATQESTKLVLFYDLAPHVTSEPMKKFIWSKRNERGMHISFVNTLACNVEYPIKEEIDYIATPVIDNPKRLEDMYYWFHERDGLTRHQYQQLLDSVPARPAYLIDPGMATVKNNYKIFQNEQDRFFYCGEDITDTDRRD
jgi:hypothetical protein